MIEIPTILDHSSTELYKVSLLFREQYNICSFIYNNNNNIETFATKTKMFQWALQHCVPMQPFGQTNNELYYIFYLLSE